MEIQEFIEKLLSNAKSFEERGYVLEEAGNVNGGAFKRGQAFECMRIAYMLRNQFSNTENKIG